jgi:hypothetical protein
LANVPGRLFRMIYSAWRYEGKICKAEIEMICSCLVGQHWGASETHSTTSYSRLGIDEGMHGWKSSIYLPIMNSWSMKTCYDGHKA